ncbi:MAG: anaerobic ribonucleoside-triphosphate reductase activating protein [Planctomycetota bacterium]|jgi:pyruvate formate lyase activating enzyme
MHSVEENISAAEKKYSELPVIRGFLPTSLNEWPGKISAVLFLQGCNMLCPFCHGWSFVLEPDQMPEIPAGEVFEHLIKKQGWIDGVVISGGEPTLSPSLEHLVDEIIALDYKVKLHSNGLRPEILNDLLRKEKLSCLALDFKSLPENESLSKAAGKEVSVEAVKKSFEIAGSSGIEIELHTTLCPGIISIEDLKPMAEYLKETVPGGKWFLQQYNSEDVLNIDKAGRQQFSKSDIELTAEELKYIYPDINVY